MIGSWERKMTKKEYLDALDNYEFWLIKDKISLAYSQLGIIFYWIILFDGKIYDYGCLEKKFGKPELNFAPRYCCLDLIITLPKGMKEEFEEKSGLILTKVPSIQQNSL